MIFKIGHKTIGELENGVFFKEVMKSKHLFRVLDAFGIDSKVLHKLPPGTKIAIHELEEDKWYKTTKEEFLEQGETYLHFKQPKEDFRAQLFLKRSKFKVEEPVKLEGEALEKHNYMVVKGLHNY